MYRLLHTSEFISKHKVGIFELQIWEHYIRAEKQYTRGRRDKNLFNWDGVDSIIENPSDFISYLYPRGGAQAYLRPRIRKPAKGLQYRSFSPSFTISHYLSLSNSFLPYSIGGAIRTQISVIAFATSGSCPRRISIQSCLNTAITPLRAADDLIRQFVQPYFGVRILGNCTYSPTTLIHSDRAFPGASADIRNGNTIAPLRLAYRPLISTVIGD